MIGDWMSGSPLFATPLKHSGYTWTIASRVGNALADAEDKFGPRDTSYFYAGHEFVEGNPNIWFPGNRRHIVIQLGKECLADMAQAISQLSHEVIHLLAPSGGANANNLEEGLATWFSEDYCRRVTGQTLRTSLPCYKRAGDLVQRMLEASPDCIKSMRREEPNFSKITRGLLRNNCSILLDSEVEFLLAKFQRSIPASRTLFDAQNPL